MKFESFLCSALAVLVSAAGVAADKGGIRHVSNRELRPAIVEGVPAGETEFPFFVDWGGCGGTLVYEDIVLTAAHCNPIETNEVEIGAYFRDQSNTAITEERHIVERRVHPQYDGRGFCSSPYDVMVLKLDSASSILPIELNRFPSKPIPGNNLVAIGHGCTNYDDFFNFCTAYSPVLMKLNMTRLPGECTKTKLCAEAPNGGSACLGDSGGPLLELQGSEYVQVGVSSTVTGLCQVGSSTNEFASVSSHKKWVDDQVCSLSSNPPSRCTYELFDEETKTPLRGSCNAFDQVYADLCPPVDTSVPNPEFLPPGGNSPTSKGYCCGSWGSGGTCPNSWQNSWRRAFPSVIVPECDGKEEPDECEVVLVRDEVGLPHAACSVGEGNWPFPSISCWTGNDLTSEIRIGVNTKVTLCNHSPDCSGGGTVYIRTESDGPESVTFGGLSELRVECTKSFKQAVSILGNTHIKDGEFWKDEIFDERVDVTLVVDPKNPTSSEYVEHRVGGEIRVELTFNAVLQYDHTVSITAEQKLYEGISTNTNDLEDEDDNASCVDENSDEEMVLYTFSSETSGDYATTTVTIENIGLIV